MGSIRALESGGGNPAGDYGAMGVPTKYGRALGAYQIMSDFWDDWAKEAGYAGASWRDPAVQDAVARYKMDQYFAAYGRWDAVAVAWFAGPGRVDDYLAGKDLSAITDALGTSVPKYANYIATKMQEVAQMDPNSPGLTGGSRGSGVSMEQGGLVEGQQPGAPVEEMEGTPAGTGMTWQFDDPLKDTGDAFAAGPGEEVEEPEPLKPEASPDEIVSMLLDTISHDIAGGERLDYRTLQFNPNEETGLDEDEEVVA